MSIATTVAAMPTGLYTSVPLKRRSEVNPTMTDAGRAITTERITRNSLTHQNSLRLARPVKVAYFLKKRPTAWPKLAPYKGRDSIKTSEVLLM